MPDDLRALCERLERQGQEAEDALPDVDYLRRELGTSDRTRIKGVFTRAFHAAGNALDVREAARRLRAVHDVAAHGTSLPSGQVKATCALVMDALEAPDA